MTTKKNEETPPPARGTVTLVYIGLRLNVKDKLFHVFRKLNDDGTLDAATRYYSKLKRRGRPGGVYLFECEAGDESSIYSAGWKYRGAWAQTDAQAEEVLRWQLEHDTARTRQMMLRRQATEGKRNLVEEQLAPLRRMYHESPIASRAALLAQIIHYITR